ncbi:BQ5605_C013g07156 [Microbotryum silenes-dioicae]|uniref:BQ5605_C013g07156 protein n=1 Tax=Microbotryum silenes-dioicae TaxID=796604 RepID=A0A2X0MKG0_9BASI|nr:BQ5605_C013g07156 [Microbotryum silenes-dioicae]
MTALKLEPSTFGGCAISHGCKFDSDAFTRSSSGALYHKSSNRQVCFAFNNGTHSAGYCDAGRLHVCSICGNSEHSARQCGARCNRSNRA